MKTIQNAVRFTLPALALTFGMGAAAFAQTTMAPSSTPGAAVPKMNAAAPGAPASKKHASTSMTPASTSSMATSSASKMASGSEFKTVDLAQAHCPGDTVVWSTLSKSHTYHMSTSKYYGKTKHGAYVCEKEATAAGFHASKS